MSADRPGTRGLFVAKLGGSLLDFNQLESNLKQWVGQQDATVVLVVGGGMAVDRLRQQSEHSGLCDSDAHWLAIDIMDHNAGLISTAFPDWVFTDQLETILAHPTPSVVIFAPKLWLESLEYPLPESWDVTSDSIAAELARQLDAELVLLKSADAPENPTLELLNENGLVDRYFGIASRGLTVRMVNLRRQPFAETSFNVSAIG